MGNQEVKPFHQWKEELRAHEAPLVRPRDEYYTLYGRYVWRERNKDEQDKSGKSLGNV